MTLNIVTTMDQKIAEWFNALGQDSGWPWGNLILCVIAIILTVALCFIIGFEREKRGRSAGLRTHLLVGLGSCVIMIISIYGFPTYESRDVARLAASVVTGVGFLGTGTIIHANGGIKGLTTASTVWLSMAIGLACGSMNFILAMLAFIASYAVLVGLRPVERKLTKNHPTIIVSANKNCPITSILLSASKETECVMKGINTQFLDNGDVQMCFKLSNESEDEMWMERFILLLKENPDIKNVEVLNIHKK